MFMPLISRAHTSNLSKRTHWPGRISRWVWRAWTKLEISPPVMHQNIDDCFPCCLPRTYFWSRDRCLWRRGTWNSFSKLLKSTQMPPAASKTTCSTSLRLPLCLCLDLSNLSIWCSHCKLLWFLYNPHNLPSLSSFLAFQSRTCLTDHASSCMSFGRTVSPGWGRIRRVSWHVWL